MLETPVLFLIFNRPDVTERVFEVIRKQQPKKLFIAADGPRPNRSGEKELCLQTRQLATQIDWTCEWKTWFRDQNVGCGKAVSSAIDWFFEQVDEGIILEDDCLPHPDFFSFCESLLLYYRNDAQVMHISGNSFQRGKKRGEASYYFSHYPLIWGWATWRRAWHRYDYSLEHLNFDASWTQLSFPFFQKNEQQYWFQTLQRTKRAEIDTWDHQWFFTLWYENGLAIHPNSNLVTNIGFGDNATHTIQSISPSANLPVHDLPKIVHPPSKKVDKYADRFTYRNHINTPTSRINKIRNFSYKYFPKDLVEWLRRARRNWLPGF